MFITEKRAKRLKSVISNRLQDVIVLENIHDPYNAMAALRNCDAFGIQTAHFIFETEKIFNPKKLGKATSSSANKWVDVITWTSTVRCIDTLKKKGYRIISTIVDAKAKRLTKFHFPKQKVAIVFGNEGFGVGNVAKKTADETMYIPMYGFVDSLNLSVSVGIMLWELRKQREKSMKFALLQEDQNRLFKTWMNKRIEDRLRNKVSSGK